MDGNPVPHDILKVMGVEALAEYLINEIQDVYRLQGVRIDDKDIEVIVRQIKRWRLPTAATHRCWSGNSSTARSSAKQRQGKGSERQGGEGHSDAAGNTKASLQTSLRFYVLPGDNPRADRQPSRKRDNLVGLKENVIVKCLIPAGTGSVMNRFRAIAADRDKERREMEAATAALEAAVAEDKGEVVETVTAETAAE